MPTQTGILEITDGKGGRLRVLEDTLIASASDPFVPPKLIDRFQLRGGVVIEATTGKPMNNNGGGGGKQDRRNRRGRGRNNNQRKEKPSSLAGAPRVEQVIQIDGLEPDAYIEKTSSRKFEDLTTIDPQPRMTLEYPGCPPACRLIDLFCPIGFGTRGLIVSPPKAGKTTLLHQIATSIERNYPHVEVVALLVDERPEEVTDFRRNVPCKVLASSNDHTPERHVALAKLTIERAKRQAEAGQDVVILLDSLTRLGRAFNTAPGQSNTGRTLSGGIDAGVLGIPKQLFGAARKFEEGGSLTILATALVDTGSRGDQVIFEEFKGTGNMELILDRKIAERRVFPAINLAASGTRKEHLLMTEKEYETTSALRRRLLNMQSVVQVEQLLKALERFKTNAELVGERSGSSAAAASA